MGKSAAKIVDFVSFKLAVVAVALSFALSLAIFREKPRTSSGNKADAHYGEGPVFAFDDNQRRQVERIMKVRGSVTLEQIEEVMKDGSGSPRLGTRRQARP